MKALLKYFIFGLFFAPLLCSCSNHEDELLDHDLPGGDEDRPNTVGGSDTEEEEEEDPNEGESEDDIPKLTNVMAFLSDGTQWEVLTYSTITPTPQETVVLYAFNGQAQIDEHECLQYYQITSGTTRKELLMGYIFVEGEQVFYIYPEVGKEEPILIYDFDLSIGEVITVHEVCDPRYSNYDPRSIQMCMGKGRITSCGNTYEYQEMCELLTDGTEPAYTHQHGQWIKGIGGLNFMNGIFGNSRYDQDGVSSVLQSVIVDGETVYSLEDATVLPVQ